MNSPLISVIIPIYNVEQYILKCLTSIVGQDINAHVQILLIDDCGQDNSFRIAEQYALTCNNPIRSFKLIKHSVNKGLGGARNTGIDNADGKFIVFVDSDDTLPSNALSSLVNAFEISDVDIVDSQNSQIDEDGNCVFCPKSFNSHILNNDEIWQIGKQWKPTAWAKLIKRSFIIDNNLYFKEKIFHEDLHWSMKVASANPIIKVIPNVTYNYLQRQSSIIHTIGEKHMNSFIEIFNDLTIFFKANHTTWNQKKINKFINTFDYFRIVAIDTIYPYIDSDKQKIFFKQLVEFKLNSISNIIKTKDLPLKSKIKLFPLYCSFGHGMIVAKAKVSKFISSIFKS